ncbi:hypothetical protein PI124_g8933 [Phytophthora idaei]|nr:hypothetical protein PI124_g8933 [Phytophthora idaei]
MQLRKGKNPTCSCVGLCLVSCTNRRRRVECGPATCSIGESCSNRTWSTYGYDDVQLEIKLSPIAGYGAFALQPIFAGILVREYVGEIIDEDVKQKWYEEAFCEYLMVYGPNKYIDAKKFGNDSRFFNHSSAPNCRAEEWTVTGIYRIGIFAIQNIEPGEEITFNYGRDYAIEQRACKQCVRSEHH